MRRKYYLRGLGIGILITSLVFIIAGPSELSEEEIISRAEQLGYTKIEKEVTPSIGIKELLENATPFPTPTERVPITGTPTPTVIPTPTPTETPEPTESPSPTEAPLPTATTAPTATVAPTPTPTTAPESSNVVTASITVERGNTATVVCEKIEAAGIVKDGNDFKNYLIRKNLTDYINIGTYTLSGEMSYEQIAKILTGK